MHKRIIRTACKLIEDNLQNPDLGVSWLASRLGTDLIAFSRAFSKAQGIPCSKYIAIRRIEAAKRILKNRELRIGEVARRFGFEDPNYFARVFKKFTGMSPTSYRKIMARRSPSVKRPRKKML